MKLEEFKRFRVVLRDTISSKLDNRPVALLFSGGTDSLVILWTLMDLEIPITCYLFRLECIVSKDSIAAHLASKTWNIPLVEVIIPHQDTNTLMQDIRQLVREMGTSRKTAIECTWPFTHMISHIKEDQVWCGLNADDLWGSSREISIRYGSDPTGFQDKREALINNYYSSAWGYIEQLFKKVDKELLSPYRYPQIIEYLLGFNWEQLNRPKQKMPAYIAFGKEFSKVAIWRRNDNLQCGSGIREYLARLLLGEENIGNHCNMASLYKEILRQERGGYIQSQLAI